MASAYFGNSVNDQISVNLNNQRTAKELDPRALDTEKEVYTLPYASYEISANKGKGVFGGRGTVNKVEIQFEGLADPATYTVAIDSTVTGQDLYFYVFENTLVGQDQAGRSSGITIKDATPPPPALKTAAKRKATK
jgi:hypothetical protein